MSIMGSVGRWLQHPPSDDRHLRGIKINHTASATATAAAGVAVLHFKHTKWKSGIPINMTDLK